jgi:N-methylhydantoinase A
VTDADLVLGLLDADNFLGGEMKLDLPAARAAAQRVGDQLGTGVIEAARGIYRIVAEAMASATRAHATDRGVDYRGMPLFAFGGAGPAHACEVGALLSSTAVIFPPQASVLSAFGTLVTPPRLDLSRGELARLSALDWKLADDIFTRLVDDGKKGLAGAGCAAGDVTYRFGADMRYFGQQNEITAWFESDPRRKHDAAWLREVFEQGYERLYSLRLPEVDIEIVSWRIVATGPAASRDSVPMLQTTPAKPRGRRKARFNGNDVDAPVYARSDLAFQQVVAGPAIIEERETTIIILPGWQAKVDRTGCIMASKESASKESASKEH